MDAQTAPGAVVEALVTLADSLRAGYDVLEVLNELVCASIAFTGAVDAGVLFADHEGELHVVASTSQRARDIDAVVRRADRGPGIASIRSGEPLAVSDIAETGEAWPEFALVAGARGIRSAYAVPLSLRGAGLGALSLYFESSGPASERDVAVALAFAQITAIGIVQHRTIATNRNVSAQMRTALGSRVVIEQAKGFLAHRHGIAVDDAFLLLRDYARRHGTGLREVAEQVVSRGLDIRGVG